MFSLKHAKYIIQNAPKYDKIVEPFGDNGSIAFELDKKRPSVHLLNVENEMIFNLFVFFQNLSSSDKSAIKSKDWISSQETFNTVLKISAMDGVDFFYRWMYLQNFGISDMKNMETDPVWDWTSFGEDIKDKTYDLPLLKAGLKGVTLSLGDPIAFIGKASGTSTFLILNPKSTEQVAAVDAKVGSLTVPFWYQKKSKSNDELMQTAEAEKNKVSRVNSGAVMPGTAQIITNYENKLIDLKEGLIEASPDKTLKS